MKASEPEGTEYVSSSDGETFQLDNMSQIKVSCQVEESGRDYYLDNRVCFLELDGQCGRALVEGTETYEEQYATEYTENGGKCGYQKTYGKR